MVKLIAGNSNKPLARQIAMLLGIEYIDADSKKFPDGEIKIQLNTKIASTEIFILQSLSDPVNDNLIELLLLTNAVKCAGAKKITAIIPYLAYARQDKSISINSPISIVLIASLIKTAGVDEIITVDIHSSQSEMCFQIPIYNLTSHNVFLPTIKQFNNYIIVAPDLGARHRACNIAKLLGSKIVFINKTRTDIGEIKIIDFIGNVKRKNCLIIDDIVDSGNTLLQTSIFLLNQGALSVNAFITHIILSNGADAILNESILENIYTTNTIHKDVLPNKVTQLSIAGFIAEFIKTKMQIYVL